MCVYSFQTSETIYQAYKRLDQQICKLEGMCPGPRLTTVEAWIEFLEADQHKYSISSPQLFQNQNDPLDFREIVARMDKEKSNIRTVRSVFFLVVVL